MGTYGSGLYGRAGATYGELSLHTVDSDTVPVVAIPLSDFEGIALALSPVVILPNGEVLINVLSDVVRYPVVITLEGEVLIDTSAGFYI